MNGYIGYLSASRKRLGRFSCAGLFMALGILSFAGILFAAGNSRAASGAVRGAALCDRAAIEASRSESIPLDVLKAISRTETGRLMASGLQPWPWTVNMEGVGRWFSNLDEAKAYVSVSYAKGKRSFDVGCFQINYKWHGTAFRSFDDMFDPVLNAKYAAGYLADLYREFGNWPDAIGAYHSRNPELAKKYVARFERIRLGLPDALEGHRNNLNDRWARDNAGNRRLALTERPGPLVDGDTFALGSLVPISNRSGTNQRPFVLLQQVVQ